VCRKHQNHWLLRNLVVGLSFLAIASLSIALFVVAAGQEQRRRDQAFFGLACGGTVVLLLAWVIATVIVSLTTVRAQDINQDEMLLAGVSPEFADALSDLPFDDDEDYPRGQRRRRRVRRPRQEDEYAEEDRDDDRPRRRRPPSDAFEERD
jgi:hypothetical protein